MRKQQVIYDMKDAVFAAADALKDGGAGAGEAAVHALLDAWFAKQSEPAALFSDGLAVPALAVGPRRLEAYTCHDGPCFAVCALCGRGAYERGLRDYAVAAAYLEAGELQAAMVFDPSHAELYHAVKNLGAYMNGRSLSVSRCRRVTDAFVSADHATLRTARQDALFALLAQAQSLRCGAAFSLELCHLAGGRIDAAIGHTQPFIAYAAGQLIAREAGAALLGRDGRPLPPMDEPGAPASFAAVSPGIAAEMGALLAAM